VDLLLSLQERDGVVQIAGARKRLLSGASPRWVMAPSSTTYPNEPARRRKREESQAPSQVSKTETTGPAGKKKKTWVCGGGYVCMVWGFCGLFVFGGGWGGGVFG